MYLYEKEGGGGKKKIEKKKNVINFHSVRLDGHFRTERTRLIYWFIYKNCLVFGRQHTPCKQRKHDLKKEWQHVRALTQSLGTVYAGPLEF